MPDFELDKLDWYTVDTVEPNDFINENLTSDEYGIYYSVKFVGNAESYLWQTKTPPVKGEDYWGMLQKAKSGKSVKFKWDKKNTPETTPDGKPSTTSSTKSDTYFRDATTVPIDMIRALLPYFDVQSLKPNSEQYRTLMELAQNLTEDALTMVEAIRKGEKSNNIEGE